MQRWIWLGCAAAIGVAIALPAEAQWKWRDGNGRVQYSDLPPPASVPDKDVLQRPQAAQRVATPADAPASAASAPLLSAKVGKSVEPELEAKRRKAEEEKAAKDKLEEQRIATAKADNCSRARSQMRTLDDGIRIARTNAKGEREILDDQGRAAERQRTLDIIASDCK